MKTTKRNIKTDKITRNKCNKKAKEKSLTSNDTQREDAVEIIFNDYSIVRQHARRWDFATMNSFCKYSAINDFCRQNGYFKMLFNSISPIVIAHKLPPKLSPTEINTVTVVDENDIYFALSYKLSNVDTTV